MGDCRRRKRTGWRESSDKEIGRDGLCEVHDEMVRRVPEVRPELAKTTAGDGPSGIEPRITKGQ